MLNSVAVDSLAAEVCPTHLCWPAFGATYPDTVCIDGRLWDLDSGYAPGTVSVGGDAPCPFCNPVEFTTNLLDGTFIVPTCAGCETRLPSGTPIHYHDGQTLTFSATCPMCGPQRVLMRDYEQLLPVSEIHAWHADEREDH